MSDAYICAFWGQCYQLNYGKNNMVVNAIASEFRIGEKKRTWEEKDFVLTYYVRKRVYPQSVLEIKGAFIILFKD